MSTRVLEVVIHRMSRPGFAASVLEWVSLVLQGPSLGDVIEPFEIIEPPLSLNAKPCTLNP